MHVLTKNPGRALRAAAAGLLILATGCADADLAEPNEDEPELLAAVADVSVRASGAGCPAGKWRSEGELQRGNFRILFDAYQVSASPSKVFATANCTIELKPSTPWKAYTAYFLRGFTVVGDARLPAGVNATVHMGARHTIYGTETQQRPWARLDGVHNNTFIAEDNRRFMLSCGQQTFPVSVVTTVAARSDGAASGAYTIREIKDFRIGSTPCSTP